MQSISNNYKNKIFNKKMLFWLVVIGLMFLYFLMILPGFLENFNFIRSTDSLYHATIVKKILIDKSVFINQPMMYELIPFSYPPLAHIVWTVFCTITGLNIISTHNVLAIITTLLIIFLFYPIAMQLCGRRLYSLLVMFFALLTPVIIFRSFIFVPEYFTFVAFLTLILTLIRIPQTKKIISFSLLFICITTILLGNILTTSIVITSIILFLPFLVFLKGIKSFRVIIGSTFLSIVFSLPWWLPKLNEIGWVARGFKLPIVFALLTSVVLLTIKKMKHAQKYIIFFTIIILVLYLAFRSEFFSMISQHLFSNSFWKFDSFWGMYLKICDAFIGYFVGNYKSVFSLNPIVFIIETIGLVIFLKNKQKEKPIKIVLLTITFVSVFLLISGPILGIDQNSEVDRFAIYAYSLLIIFTPFFFKKFLRPSPYYKRCLAFFLIVVIAGSLPNILKKDLRRDPIYYSSEINDIINYFHQISKPTNIYTDSHTARILYISTNNQNLNFLQMLPAMGQYKNYYKVQKIMQDLSNLNGEKINKYDINYIVFSPELEKIKRNKELKYNIILKSGDYKIVNTTK